jgi:hypothetical protein
MSYHRISATKGYSILIGRGTDATQANSTEYGCLNGQSELTGSESSHEQKVPANGYISYLHAEHTAQPGAGESFTFTLRVNNADTALTCQIAGTDKTASDTTHMVEVSEGDIVNLKIVGTAGALAGYACWGAKFTPRG